MIIVEGGDNTGKSTLVQQLLEQDSSLKLLKRDKFNPNRGESIGSSYLDMLTPTDGNFEQMLNSVADRCLASECIYGRLFRQGCRMTDGEHIRVQAMLQRYNAIVVWCDPPDEVIGADWEKRPQLYPENPLLIAAEYRKEIPKIFKGLEIFRYDWTLEGEASVKRFKIIEKNRENVLGVLKYEPFYPHEPVPERTA